MRIEFSLVGNTFGTKYSQSARVVDHQIRISLGSGCRWKISRKIHITCITRHHQFPSYGYTSLNGSPKRFDELKYNERETLYKAFASAENSFEEDGIASPLLKMDSETANDAPEQKASGVPPFVLNPTIILLTILRPHEWLGYLFRTKNKERVWKVPWESDTIFLVMLLWLFAFWLVGSWIMPLAAQALGCCNDAHNMRELAVYHLITDVVELTVGLGVLRQCLARFSPLPKGWFPVRWKGFWFMESFFACAFFPVVHALARVNMRMLPVRTFPTQIEQSFTVKDPIALLVYVAVVSICAPIWEEIIFRGFLLPSLTRYLPVWASVLVSATVFAVAHFQPQRILPLLFLGIIIGTVFVRSRNLLASMLLHSLWNGYVFFELFLKCYR